MGKIGTRQARLPTASPGRVLASSRHDKPPLRPQEAAESPAKTFDSPVGALGSVAAVVSGLLPSSLLSFPLVLSRELSLG